jgi:hypothetical protein
VGKGERADGRVAAWSAEEDGKVNPLRESVHDNHIYAQAVDHERCRIVLHTVWPHCEPPEYTDIVFDVEESDPLLILGQYEELLARTRNYGWPVFQYDGLADLAAQLTAGGARCFEVHGVCGVHGFVFARSMELRTRPSQAEVTG